MIEFTWDERKARRNEREHGISFNIAQAALEGGMGVELGEQFRDEEWRTLVVAPFRGSLMLHITFAFYGRGEDEDSITGIDEETEQDWSGEHGVIRIISAREATKGEQDLYFQYRPQSLG
jgi:uncharacterized DUF497 family protein